ncbi:tyrosine--tRNA ligase [soil metagenome]
MGNLDAQQPAIAPPSTLEPPSRPPSAPSQVAAWLARNAVDSLPHGGLEAKLVESEREDRPLRVKLGIDPTSADIHLGHTVVLRKLREFQELGHLVVLIIGDYTARVGDPSGRVVTRPMLDPAEIEANARTYQEQAFKVLDGPRVEVRRNGEWLDMAMVDLFRLARTATVAQLLERDDFAKRYAAGEPITVLELLYPLMQGYDSVEVDADVELGGTDQKFNLLLGRDVQRAYARPEQAVLTMPILPGTDGERKMSKSLGNHVGIAEPAQEIYGKTLSLPDEAMESWYRLLLGEPARAGTGPRDAKRALARRLTAEAWDEEAASRAEADFDRRFVENLPPEDVPEVEFGADGRVVHVPAVISEVFGGSRSQARRLIAQGGVRLDGHVLGPEDQDVDAERLDGSVLQIGKRRWARLRARRKPT